MTKTVAAVFAMVLSWSCGGKAATIVGFTGPYAPENWTVKSSGCIIDLSSELLKATTINNLSYASFSITIVETGTIAFDWGLTNRQGYGSLEAFVSTSISKYNDLISTPRQITESQTINVVAGETLTFSLPTPSMGSGVYKWDNDLKVFNFRAEGVVPEPSVSVIVSVGILGFAGLRRLRRVSTGMQTECA